MKSLIISASHADPAVDCVTTPVSTTPVSAPVFDSMTALQLVEGDRELLQEMLTSFKTQAPRLLANISDAIHHQDGSALETAAHKLKGSLGSFGAGGALATALDLETRGHWGNFDSIDEVVGRLRTQLEVLMRALTQFASADAHALER